jgi:hypothetical protein
MPNDTACVEAARRISSWGLKYTPWTFSAYESDGKLYALGIQTGIEVCLDDTEAAREMRKLIVAENKQRYPQ